MKVVRIVPPTLLVVAMLLAVGWMPHGDDSTRLEERLRPPSVANWAGTDHLGRDVLGRTLRAVALGARTTVPAWVIATAIGAFIGMIGATQARRPLGRIIDFAIQVMFCTPFVLVLIGVGVVFERGPSTVFWIIVLIGWAAPARLALALGRDALGAPYAEAARSFGFDPPRIALFVLVPACLHPIMAANGGLLAEILALDATLTLFGLGPTPPVPTIGGLVSDGLRFATVAPWMAATPLLVLCALCLCLRGTLVRSTW